MNAGHEVKTHMAALEGKISEAIQEFVDATGFVPDFDYSYTQVIAEQPRVRAKIVALRTP